MYIITEGGIAGDARRITLGAVGGHDTSVIVATSNELIRRRVYNKEPRVYERACVKQR